MVLETERLILREMNLEDFEALYEIFSDEETMKYYPSPFSKEKTKDWIKRNQKRYTEDGFGLWAVIHKESDMLIGDCGITMQNIHGKLLPEIGYHIHKAYQRKGYGSEAAEACIQYAFEKLKFNQVYSYMKYTNEASIKTALKNGLRFVEEYKDEINEYTRVYSINKEEWEAKNEK